MATGLASWSSTAAANATADANVNWAEGQAPSSVNDSARAMMASLRKWLNDICGVFSTGGTSTAYTVTTQQGFASLAAMNGQIFGFTPHTTNGATVTLAVDGLTAKPLRPGSNVEFAAGALTGGTPYLAMYNSADAAFYTYNISGTFPFTSLQPIASVSVLGNSSNVSSTPTTINLETPIAFTNATSIGITTAGIAYSKIQNVASVSLLGCGSTTSTAVTEIKLGSTLKFTNASTLDVNTVSAASITTGQLALARGGTNADLSATGGAGQVLKQAGVGSAVTVGLLTLAEMSLSSTGTGAVVLQNSPTLVTPDIGSATGTSLSVSGNLTVGGTFSPGNISATGFVKSVHSQSGVGYGAGAGGSVTQTTSKQSSVTLNTITGLITTASTVLSASTTLSFTVVNSCVTATDLVALNLAGLTAGTYYVTPKTGGNGSFQISLFNNTAGSLSEAIPINFVVLKGVTA